MENVIGIRFKRAGKIYYFLSPKETVEVGMSVIVETVRGLEFGTCVTNDTEIDINSLGEECKPIIRIATENDKLTQERNKKKEAETFEVCEEKIKKHELQMKLIDVEYTFDSNKLIFYFTAEGRIDFRELVKDLASIFKTRIELRQIGIRDESKIIGGIGSCGRTLCCASFLDDFASVSIKMAKEQGLSLNPNKISGICGRLMCCLNYEQKMYEKIRRVTPKPGSIVKTIYGEGEVIHNSIIAERLKVKVKVNDEERLETFRLEEVELIRGGYIDVISEEELRDIDLNNVKEILD